MKDFLIFIKVPKHIKTMQNVEELVDIIGSAVSEFNYETGEDNFEITITIKCEGGFVSEESYEVKDL